AEMVEALWFGKDSVQAAIKLIEQMRDAVGKPKSVFTPLGMPENVKSRVHALAFAEVKAACNIHDKHQRYGRFKEIKSTVTKQLAAEFPEQEKHIKQAYEDLRYDTMREQ